MIKFFFPLLIMVLVVSCSVLCQTKALGGDNWVDYASGEYAILPNITYSTANNTALKLDLYLPRDRSIPLPTLIIFHGGGWVAGLKEQNVFEFLPYLSLGWAVINVEYRLASNTQAPAAVEDCRCALRWVENNAKRFNFDVSKIVPDWRFCGRTSCIDNRDVTRKFYL